MLNKKINELKREVEFAENKLMQNLNNIERKDILNGIIESFATLPNENDKGYNKDFSTSPILAYGKKFLFLYQKIIHIKRLYNLFKNAT